MAQVRKLVDQDEDGLIREEKRKKKAEKQNKQCKGYYSTPPHQQTDTQLDCEQWLSSQRPLPLVFMAECDVIWNEISLWSVEVSCPSCVPSQLLVHPQPTRWWGGVTNREGLDTV